MNQPRDLDSPLIVSNEEIARVHVRGERIVHVDICICRICVCMQHMRSIEAKKLCPDFCVMQVLVDIIFLVSKEMLRQLAVRIPGAKA